MQDAPVHLYGATYSVYVRICRMALAAKGVDYQLMPVDVFADGGPGHDHLERQPFGKIPAFEHGDFALFETDAIVSYVERAFDGPPLECRNAAHHTRMRQLMRIVDNYAYPALVWKCYVPETAEDREVAAESWDAAAKVLAVVACLMGPSWMAGPALSLADIYMWAALAYFRRTERGPELIAAHAGLAAWCDRMAEHPVSVATGYEVEM
ncbi:MAG: glutathione S-transferase [Rhizobiales bacterium]|nr:glutathione S-transferase [Hyphomicrobiales bacterium]